MLSEKVKQFFTALKECQPHEIPGYFTPVTEWFPVLPGDEKKQFALDFFTWAEKQASGGSLKFGYAHYVMGLAHFFNGAYEETLMHAKEAREIFSEQKDQDGIALSLLLFGGVYRTLGDPTQALKVLQEAREQLAGSGAYPHNRMACDYQIASIYAEMDHSDEAVPLFTDVYEMATKLDNQLWIMNALHGLGKAYSSMKRYDEARDALEKARTIAESIQNPTFLATSLTDLANYYYEIADFDTSARLHMQAMEQRQKENYLTGVVTNCIHLAKIYSRQGKAHEAIAILEKGLGLAEQIRVKPKIYQIHLLLSGIYEQEHQLEKSLEHYKSFQQVKQEAESEETGRRIKHAQLLFEAEKTMKENAIIRQQKKEIEAKNIELQNTIDELTRTRVGKRAKAYTLAIAIVLFILEELFLHYVLHLIGDADFYLSFAVKMVIIFSLKPIDAAIEHYLLRKIIRKKPRSVVI